MLDAGQEQLKNVLSKSLAVGTSYSLDKAFSVAYNQPLLQPYAVKGQAIKKAITGKG